MALNTKTDRMPAQIASHDTECAFLWDESFLWGLMAYNALTATNLSFELISSEDIRNDALDNYSLLFVPGGWASNKLKTLGDKGVEKIRKFVRAGGNYLGFCGGAGLATMDGIGLLPIARRHTKERVPSFSGRIRLIHSDHPIWQNIAEPIFHAWWPSQFVLKGETIEILATYGDALPDSFSSDLNVGDVEAAGEWATLEKRYQINLNPRRLYDEPAIVEGTAGKGKVVLSLVHFDTPDDGNGSTILQNLWSYLTHHRNKSSRWSNRIQYDDREKFPRPPFAPLSPGRSGQDDNLALISEMATAVRGLILLGERNFLWFWRNPLLLQWRRGVRGLEYCSLFVMVNEIMEIMGQLSDNSHMRPQSDQSLSTADRGIVNLGSNLKKICHLLFPFVKKAERLLLLERFAMQHEHITYERCDEPEIQKIRSELFSSSKSHGGLFKRLIDEVDATLFALIRQKSID
ncbi:MAG: BPL-N domain-containing protein [Dissulfurispiraceae bacterium]